MSMKTLSVVVPSHNEGQTIGAFVQEISNLLSSSLQCKLVTDYEIIILDDGSEDNTKEVLKSLNLPKTKYIYNDLASGIHSAFLQLYKEAKMYWVLLVPGDAQWPSREIEKLIRFHFGSANLYPTVTKRHAKIGYSCTRLFLSSSFGMFASLFLDYSDRTDPGSIKILPRDIATKKYVSNSVLIEIERMLFSEFQFGELRQFEIDTILRIHGESSTLHIKTLRPVVLDCFKMLYYYKFYKKYVTDRKESE